MPADPLAEYFTPERRGRFEELRERYPHWCLDWPKVAGLRAPTTSVRRLAGAIQEMREDLKSWEHSPQLPKNDERLEAWADEVTGRAFMIDNGDECTDDQAEIDVPAIHLALFKAIALTLNTRLERGLLLGDWFNRLQLILVADDRDSSKTRGKLARLAAKAWVDGAEAAWSGNQMQQTKADEARERLSQYWRLIGERIGLIPTRRGGRADLIPKKWLSDLAKQANELLVEVRAYQPDTAERDAVRALLLAKPYPAGSSGTRSIAEQHLKDDRTREDAYASWDGEVNLDRWCLRLAFPMLTQKELADAQSKRGWRWLPAGRLSMDEDILSKRKTP